MIAIKVLAQLDYQPTLLVVSREELPCLGEVPLVMDTGRPLMNLLLQHPPYLLMVLYLIALTLGPSSWSVGCVSVLGVSIHVNRTII